MRAQNTEQIDPLEGANATIIELETKQKTFDNAMEEVKQDVREVKEALASLRADNHKLELKVVASNGTLTTLQKSLNNFYNQTFKPLSETVEKLRSQQLKLIGASIILIPLISWGLERLADRPVIDTTSTPSQERVEKHTE